MPIPNDPPEPAPDAQLVTDRPRVPLSEADPLRRARACYRLWRQGRRLLVKRLTSLDGHRVVQTLGVFLS